MAYKHGIYTGEQATSLVPMTETEAGLVVAFGTAPVHLASAPAEANKPVLCYTLKEAVAALGYSDDWEKYTLCEAMKVHFALFNVAPIVLVNVLDSTQHTKSQEKKEIKLESGVATIEDAILLGSLKIFKTASDTEAAAAGTDYTAAYNDNNAVVVTTLTGGKLDGATSVYAAYTAIDATKVTAADIVGGVSNTTGKSTGLELIEEIYPRFGIVPGTMIAPGWSHNTVVAAVMKAKEKNINGHFNAISICDAPTNEVKAYSAVSEWKNKNNYVDNGNILCWPLLTLGGTKYHMSTQLASLLAQVDSENDDIPYYSPSNHSLQADGACLEDGTEVFLSSSTAAYLNGQGVVTALNFIGGWKAFGNRLTAYPSNTDVKDSFIAIRRMFNWVGNTLVTTFWSKIDKPTNKRLIASIVTSANVWLNGLTAKGALLGGRVEFRSDENTKTDLMDGKIYFHVYITPPSPAREINFVQEYDPDYIDTLFA